LVGYGFCYGLLGEHGDQYRYHASQEATKYDDSVFGMGVILVDEEEQPKERGKDPGD